MLKYSNVKREKKRNELRSIKWTNYAIDRSVQCQFIPFFFHKEKNPEYTRRET